jgi:hypothetical protein
VKVLDCSGGCDLNYELRTRLKGVSVVQGSFTVGPPLTELNYSDGSYSQQHQKQQHMEIQRSLYVVSRIFNVLIPIYK